MTERKRVLINDSRLDAQMELADLIEALVGQRMPQKDLMMHDNTP